MIFACFSKNDFFTIQNILIHVKCTKIIKIEKNMLFGKILKIGTLLVIFVSKKKKVR